MIRNPTFARLLPRISRPGLAHVEDCYRLAADRFPAGTDMRQLALFTLTTMEGAVMLARTFRSLEPFDTAIRTLRQFIDSLMIEPRPE